MEARDPQSDFIKPRPPSRKLALLGFIVVALVLHLPLLVLPSDWLFKPKPASSNKKRVVYIQRFSRQRNAIRRKQRQKVLLKRRNKRMRPPRPVKKRKEPPKKRKKPKKIKGQIVDVAPTPDDRPPERTKFLSEYNTRVKKQTISRHRKLKYKMATSRLLKKGRPVRQQRRPLIASRIVAKRSPYRRLRLTVPRPAPRPRPTKRAPRKPKAKRTKQRKLPRVKRRRKLALPKSKKGTYKSAPKRFPIRGQKKRLSFNVGPLRLDPSLKVQPTTPGPSPQIPQRIDLRPNFGTLSRISGAPAPDHVKGIKEGDATLLNTKRYIYASFFNRVKKQVAQHWSPNTVYRRRDPYGNVYGVRSRSTTLYIELKKNGELTKVSVVRSCGLSFLDREAMRAFKAAHPFPNPPQALAGKDGKIRFKFNFYLQVSSRPGFPLFR